MSESSLESKFEMLADSQTIEERSKTEVSNENTGENHPNHTAVLI